VSHACSRPENSASVSNARTAPPVSAASPVSRSTDFFYWEPTWYAIAGNGWDPGNINGSGNNWDNMAAFDWTDHINPNIV
jgi:arabinogalactan endo-1,4-beta-galactosidase